MEFSPTLARGLSYYNGTVFEIKSPKLKETICGGGAYLIDQVQSFGFAFGVERLFALTGLEGDSLKYQVISISQDDEAIRLTQEIRDKGIPANLILNKSVPKALEYANSRGIKQVIFVGKDEVEQNKFKIKNMDSGEEKFLSKEELLN